jgi:hypothetical protein
VKNLFCLFILFLACSSPKAQNFYKTPYGAKYHLATCRMVKNVSEKVTEAEIIELGLDACKICHPEVISHSSSPSKRPAGQSETVQCKGITKAGTRCKHRTSIGNGYCFQHQPK